MATFQIADQTYDVQDMYNSGGTYTLTDGEAEALNEVRTRKLASAWGQRIRQSTKRGAEFDSSQAALEAYAANYKLGDNTRGPASTKDPYAAEAKKVAAEVLRAHVKSQGAKVADVANFDQLVEELSAREDIVAKAKERVDARGNISVGELPLEMRPAPAAPEGYTGEPTPVPAGEQYGPPEPKKNRRRDA